MTKFASLPVSMFQQGEDIDDINTLVEIAKSIGLDPNAFSSAVDGHQYEQKVIEYERLAEQIGVTGIPCIIVGNQGAMGVQTAEQIKQLLES